MNLNWLRRKPVARFTRGPKPDKIVVDETAEWLDGAGDYLWAARKRGKK